MLKNLTTSHVVLGLAALPILYALYNLWTEENLALSML